MRPSDVKAVQAVVGGDHGNMACQFGAAITAEMHDGGKNLLRGYYSQINL